MSRRVRLWLNRTTEKTLALVEELRQREALELLDVVVVADVAAEFRDLLHELVFTAEALHLFADLGEVEQLLVGDVLEARGQLVLRLLVTRLDEVEQLVDQLFLGAESFLDRLKWTLSRTHRSSPVS